MTDASNARAQNTNAAAGRTAPWPQRFGTLKSVQIKNGRKGRYAIATVDCSKFEQTAFAFGDKLVDQLIAAGAGAKVWFKGPIEPVERTNADGRTYTEDQMKIVYFKNNSAEDAEGSEEGEQAEDGDAPEAPVEPQDLTVINGIGPSIAAALESIGITTYAQLAAMTDEQIADAPFAKKAITGDWRGQAAALCAAAPATGATVEDNDEIPF